MKTEKKRLYGDKKQQRDERIRTYKEAHPDTTIRAIARMYHLSHVMILGILKDDKGQGSK
ncbi:MAG: hypothetical protein Q8O55_00635 [Dehalococcoidales bacterium]|nr:hypothetical protein [Dehalococcoidales bacterium]